LVSTGAPEFEERYAAYCAATGDTYEIPAKPEQLVPLSDEEHERLLAWAAWAPDTHQARRTGQPILAGRTNTGSKLHLTSSPRQRAEPDAEPAGFCYSRARV
jgi:hypothetical protein